MTRENNKYCIVGYGSHAKSKVVPSILNISSEIVGIVSKKKKIDETFYHFSNLEEALKKVPKKTIFILCSPPDTHAQQALKILKKGHNLFIEKPITTNKNDLIKIISLAKQTNSFFVESFMYQYSNLYEKFLKIYLNKKKLLKEINITFYIPKIPTKTFRTLNKKYSTILFDMGCYVVSLINILFDDAKFKLISVENIGISKKELFEISVKEIPVKIKAKFGINKDYTNDLNLLLNSKNFFSFKPFFYGRSGKRLIENSYRSKIKKTKIIEEDSFNNMFSKNNKYWLSSQRSRNKLMLKNLSSLENLNKQYNSIKNKK